MNLKEKKIGFIITGVNYAIKNTIIEMKNLVKQQARIVPIISEECYMANIKYGRIEDCIIEIEQITKQRVRSNLNEIESIGYSEKLDIIIIAPASGNIIGKLANNINEDIATNTVKAHLRDERPVVIAIATNDGLSGSSENIGKLLNRKNYYFVPFRQDNPITKPRSIAFSPSYLTKTIECALDGEQIQPILI